MVYARDLHLNMNVVIKFKADWISFAREVQRPDLNDELFLVGNRSLIHLHSPTQILTAAM